MYDTDLKRFYSVDPLHQFATPYCYVGNNPVSFVDPTGMAWRFILINRWYWHEDGYEIYMEMWMWTFFPEEGGGVAYYGGSNDDWGVYSSDLYNNNGGKGTPSGMSGGGSSRPNSNWDLVKDNIYFIEVIGGQTISITIENYNFSYIIVDALHIDVQYSHDVEETWSRSIERDGIYDIMPSKSKTLLFGCFSEPPIYWKIKLLTHNVTVNYIVIWEW